MTTKHNRQSAFSLISFCRMSVRTYNPSVRVGNWNEDICLQEDLLKDFLHKKDTGQLYVQKTHNLLQTLLKPVELSPLRNDELHVGDRIMLYHIPSESVVSAKLSAAEAHDATQLSSGCLVTSSKQTEPCRRNVFTVNKVNSSKPGDVICYGDHITFTTLPEEGGQLSLFSDSFTFANCAPKTRQQEVKLVEEIDYKCCWRLLCFDARYRLETEGQPVKILEPLFVNHCKTNQHLAVHTEFLAKTPYGREHEVTANTKFNIHKAEDTQNHFSIFDPTKLQ